VTSTITRYDAETCFAVRQVVGARQEIVTTPLANPALWRGAERDAAWIGADAAVRAVRFTIAAVPDDGPPETVYAEEQAVDAPGREARVSLQRFAGRTIDVRFCAAVA